jgi:hypothetical protein
MFLAHNKAMDEGRRIEVATDFRISLPNRPGVLLQMLTLAAQKDINIEGFAGDIRPGETWAYLHLLFEDQIEEARSILTDAGYEIVSEHEVDVLRVENRVGAFQDVVRGYTEAGRNIEVFYVAAEGRIVVGTEDMQRHRYGRKMGEI